MNSKPDLGILTLKDNIPKLYFIECKYTSKLDKFEYKGNNLNQLEIQEKILRFLCEYSSLRYINDNKEEVKIKKGKVILVNFVKDDKLTKDGDINILIKDIIK